MGVADQSDIGHHEGYHNDKGECLHAHYFSKCGCTGIPDNCKTADDDFWKE